jgi:hypothetical protein
MPVFGQVFLGFDPEAQPEYGMESDAYAMLLAKVRQAITTYKVQNVGKASGISARYLRSIRDGLANVQVETLRWIESATPQLDEAQSRQRMILDWARAECERIGLRELARRLGTDPRSATCWWRRAICRRR